MKMSELKPGDIARVITVEGMGETQLRLMDLGLHPGAQLKVLRKAPLGDPIEIKLKSSLIALRIKEAENVSVEKIGVAGCVQIKDSGKGMKNG